jgi:hypothetical protein
MSTFPVGRLEKLLGMLGSEHSGERAAAALKATKLLREHNATWRDVLRTPEPASSSPRRPPDERANAREVLRMNRAGLTDWECNFLNSIAAGRGPLTVRQSTKLRTIVERFA